jgi:PHD/YefM family antitoxin component YafN of YafNO toxin-antitoxin module
MLASTLRQVSCKERNGMPDLNRDINSLSNSQRTTSELLRQLKETGQPVVLTINGKAELVIQDTASYQKLVEIAERAEELEITRRAVAEMEAGQGRPAAEMLADMRRILNEKYGR